LVRSEAGSLGRADEFGTLILFSLQEELMGNAQ
jgi:hypothetical protein